MIDFKKHVFFKALELFQNILSLVYFFRTPE